jgi:hypothetical protein
MQRHGIETMRFSELAGIIVHFKILYLSRFPEKFLAQHITFLQCFEPAALSTKIV